VSDSSARLMGTLGLFGALSGVVLVSTFEATAPRIERNRAEALEAAVYRVLPGAAARAPVVLRDGVASLAEPAKDEVPAWEGRDGDGRLVGYAIPAAGAGFQDTISLLYGYDPAGRRIVGMEVLESKETPGLGDKIIKDRTWLAQFADLAVNPPPVAVKPGKGSGGAHEVDTISGATISSKAVVRIVSTEQARWGAALDTLEAP
jgi:electron transport complex protein RnfG